MAGWAGGKVGGATTVFGIHTAAEVEQSHRQAEEQEVVERELELRPRIVPGLRRRYMDLEYVLAVGPTYGPALRFQVELAFCHRRRRGFFRLQQGYFVIRVNV